MGQRSSVSAASNEQADGIQQVNKAVAEMDKVVQGNAGNAEENASASEEMNAQAEQMKQYVKELVTLAGTSSNGKDRGRHKTVEGRELSKNLYNDMPPKKLTFFNDEDFKDF